jgi:hypothetical protein
MNRRDLLRKCGTGLAAPTAIALSGCSSSDGGGGGGGDGDDSGGGDGGSGDTGGGDDTPTATPMETTTSAGGGDGEYTREGMGELVTDEVDEIEVLGWTSEVVSDQSIFQVEVTVRNAGSQETRITPGAYALVITYYDDSGSALSEGRPNSVDSRNLPSGEVASVRRNVELDDPGAVASYDISLTCDTSMGVYC